jgi:predicted Zn-dependent peptidase
MDALKQTFNEALDLFADIVLNPAFSQQEFDRLQKERLNDIRRERTRPVSMALRVFPKFIYGDGHAYSQPMTGSGYEKTVSKFTRDDMVHFYNTWIKPNHSTLVVAGNIEMKELLAEVEKNFNEWEKGDVPQKNIGPATTRNANRLYLMDRPESQQSVIIAGYVTEPYGKLPEIARESLMNVFGGEFISRINMNLREDKHWSYGAGAFIVDAIGQRPMIAYASVQTDKSKESILELRKEFTQLANEKPITEEEFERVKKNMVLLLPGFWETNRRVRYSLDEIVKYSLPDDYYQKYDKNVRSLTLGEVRDLTKKIIKPSELTWFVVGDKEKIIKGLQEIGFDEIIFVDPDGNLLTGN